MKKIIKTAIVFLLLFITLGAATCNKQTTPPPPETLPPISQTGANTFGCLINGKVWLPKGADFQLPNMVATVDPNFADGDLSIRVYRIDGDIKTSIALLSSTIKSSGLFEIGTLKKSFLVFQKNNINSGINYCVVDNGWGSENPNNVQGFLKVTKYDLRNGILSGEFEVSFNNTACSMGDPVKITQGRFDFKL